MNISIVKNYLLKVLTSSTFNLLSEITHDVKNLKPWTLKHKNKFTHYCKTNVFLAQLKIQKCVQKQITNYSLQQIFVIKNIYKIIVVSNKNHRDRKLVPCT